MGYKSGLGCARDRNVHGPGNTPIGLRPEKFLSSSSAISEAARKKPFGPDGLSRPKWLKSAQVDLELSESSTADSKLFKSLITNFKLI